MGCPRFFEREDRERMYSMFRITQPGLRKWGGGSCRTTDERRTRHAGSKHSKCGRFVSFPRQACITRLHYLFHSSVLHTGNMVNVRN